MDKHNVGLAGRMISEIFHMTRDTTNREVFGIFRYRPIFVEKEKGSFRAFCQRVPGAGLEPARHYCQWILSPLGVNLVP